MTLEKGTNVVTVKSGPKPRHWLHSVIFNLLISLGMAMDTCTTSTKRKFLGSRLFPTTRFIRFVDNSFSVKSLVSYLVLLHFLTD